MRERARAALQHRAAWAVLVALCALFGLIGRLWNLDFDQRQHQQPDERHWSFTASAMEAAPNPAQHGTVAGPVLDWLDGDRSPANAYRGTESFVYGPVTLAASRGVAGWLFDGVANGDQPASLVAHTFDAVGVPLIDDEGRPRFDSGYNVDLIGRLLGALLDTCTIVVVALIGRRLGGRRAGVVAAALYASCVLAIQQAHFLGAEPLLGLACALTVWATLRLDRSSSWRAAARGGAVAGVCAGLAVAAKLNGVGVAAVPVVLCAWLLYRHRRRADLVRLVAVAAVAVVAFRVFHPGAFNGLGWSFKQAFLDDVESSMRVDQIDMPPAVQWANRVVVLDALRWLFLFTVGPGASVAAVVGAFALWRRRQHGPRWNVAVPLLSIALPAALIMRSFNPTGRYFMALVPVLHAVAGVGVVALWGLRSTAVPPLLRARLGPALAGAAVGLGVLWGAAFVNGVYATPHTRIEATRWIQDNVPAGSVLSAQAWDDALPMLLPGVDVSQWGNTQFEMFGADSVTKVHTIAEQLVEVDYVVESSPRVWASVPRIPVRFPSTITFFAALDSGALGFERVLTIDRDPNLSLFGWEFWRLPDDAAEEAFSVYDHPEVRIWQRVRDMSVPETIAVLDPGAAAMAVHVSPQDARANGLMLYADEVAANESVGTYNEDFDTFGNPWWHALGWFLLLELSGLAAFVLFLPVLRRFPDAGAGVAKLLGLAVPAVALFVTVTWLGASFTRGLVGAVFAAWFGGAIVVGRRRVADLLAVWRDRRRTLLTVTVLTSATFVLLLALRAANPDLWHPNRAGEKPFELTMLTSVMRTRTLPTYDAWMSGGVLNYYYGGYLMLSLPGRLLRTAPTLVMNLAMAVFGSCAAGAAFTAGAAAWANGVRRVGRRVVSAAAARWAGLAAAGLLLLLPNMAMVPEVLHRLRGVRQGTFDWWALSRVIPDSVAVTEFPAWSFLFADVHPHLMDIPLLLTVMVLCLAWYRCAVERRTSHSMALALIVGLLVGLVRATNTWDYPLALATALLAVAAALLRRGDWRGAVRDVALAAFGTTVVWAPYLWRGEVYDAGVEPVTDPTPWNSWAAQWSFFAVCTLLAFAPVAWHHLRVSPRVWGVVRQVHVLLFAGALVVSGALVAAPGRATQLTSALLAIVSAGTALAARRGTGSQASAAVRRSVSVLGAGMAAVAWAALVVIEQVSVKNDGGRMNTVFKGWFQVWLLLAVGSAVSLVTLVHAAARRTDWKAQWVRRSVAAVTVFALLITVAFAVLATPARLEDRVSPGGWSLDGLGFFESDLRDDVTQQLLADDLPMLRWLQANVRGIVPVAEWPGDDYRWSSRVATYVGLPTPIGWPYHERQQKRPYGPLIDLRRTELTEIYTSTDPGRVLTLVDQYRIHYIVFGVVEQRNLPPDAPTAEGATLLATPCLDEVFRDDDTFVLEVDLECVSSRGFG